MKLVEADTEGPAESADALPRATPPRPERRRVVVSLGLTVAILAGTVITIYALLPARHDHLVAAALEEHHDDEPFELERPAPAEVRVWALALLGKAPLLPAPGPDSVVLGARRTSLLNRPAAVVRYRVGDDEVTLVIERVRDAVQRRVSRTDGDDRVEAWRVGPWQVAAVGPAATAATWSRRVGVPQKQ